DARQARCSHLLWIIENYPGAAIAGQPEVMLLLQLEKENYQKAKVLWLKQVDKHKDRATVFGNAAKFFQISDRELAESLLSKARTLEPNTSQWARELGLLYRLSAGVGIQRSAEKRKELSAKALKQFEDALKAMKTESESEGASKAMMAELGRFALLGYVAVAALDAGELKKAEAYATEMLTIAASHKSDWNYGNAVHHGNLVLGRLALASGNLAKAKQHLIEAGKTPGSPQLNSFGPNMTLAKELLEKGEKEIVLEFFQLCSKFWERDRLKQWADDVEKGRVPKFGGNLLY
ncbi:MAG: tetratricopeptide repeat protein, partial [Pirellulaceae bacterium]